MYLWYLLQLAVNYENCFCQSCYLFWSFWTDGSDVPWMHDACWPSYYLEIRGYLRISDVTERKICVSENNICTRWEICAVVCRVRDVRTCILCVCLYELFSVGGKSGRCIGLTTLPPLRADCPQVLRVSASWTPIDLSNLYRDSCTLTIWVVWNW
jgi:hypothetical protein